MGGLPSGGVVDSACGMVVELRISLAMNDDRIMNGRGERIRTSGLYVPNVALYQTKGTFHPVLTML